jgi:hypothetical protein
VIAHLDCFCSSTTCFITLSVLKFIRREYIPFSWAVFSDASCLTDCWLLGWGLTLYCKNQCLVVDWDRGGRRWGAQGRRCRGRGRFGGRGGATGSTRQSRFAVYNSLYLSLLQFLALQLWEARPLIACLVLISHILCFILDVLLQFLALLFWEAHPLLGYICFSFSSLF